MPNPILQMLSKQNRDNQNTPTNLISQIKGLMNGSPAALFAMMMQNNPEFAKFVQENKGKTPEQIAKQYGIDMNTVRTILK